MALEIRREDIEGVKRHAAQAFPNECCGVLLGREMNCRKRVLEIAPLKNARTDSPRNRVLVLPEEFAKVKQEARERQMEILGFYHSHPDGVAHPTEFDRRNAWPWFAYLIVSVEGGVVGEVICWVLSADGSQFLPDEISAAR